MGRPLRIAHIVLSLQPGGLENGVVNVINGLDPVKFQSNVVCLKSAGEFAARIKAPSAVIHVMNMKKGNDWSMPWKLARLLRRERIDIVHTRNAESFFYGSVASWLARAPALVHSEHGRTFDDHPRRFIAQRVLSHLADGIFTVSDQLKRDLCKHVGLEARRVEVIHNGVDLSRFLGADRAAARAALGVPPESVLIGSVGRLVAVKNYSMLVRALLDPELASATLVLVGEGPERAALTELASRPELSGRVRLLGHRDDIPKLLPAFDVFALPSISEGMSNTLLEAMACEVAPVASRVGGNAEIIDDGTSGLLFESNDEQGLRKALRSVVRNPSARADIAAAARRRVLSAFALPTMIGSYEALYTRLAESAGGVRCPV